jgi:hypothetical protein
MGSSRRRNLRPDCRSLKIERHEVSSSAPAIGLFGLMTVTVPVVVIARSNPLPSDATIS